MRPIPPAKSLTPDIFNASSPSPTTNENTNNKGINRILKILPTFPWSLGIALGMMAFFSQHPEWHGDLLAFRETADALRHPYWARWLFWLISLPPEPVAFVGLSLAGTGSLYWAARVFGGRHWLVFTSFAFAWILFYGQIDGLVVGGLALAWYALKAERPVLLGAGIMVALMKPQLSLPMVLAIWWWSPNRLKSFIIPGIILAVTFIQWGWWIPAWISRLFETQDLVLLSRNISLWQVIGPGALLIWPIILVLRIPRERKIFAIAAATAMSVPYFPLPSAVSLLVFPISTLAWVIVQLPLLGGLIGYWIYHIGILLPVGTLAWILRPEISRSWAHLKMLKSTH